MDIFEFALEIEANSERYYRELADRCDNPALNRILTMLAEDEVKHYQTILAMRDGSHPEMPLTQVLPRARDRFSAIKKTPADLCFNDDEIALYRQALTKEDQAENFYREKAALADDPGSAKLLEQLADEERRHRFLIEHIIEFLSRPNTWIENAEFNHLEEY